MRLFLTQLNLNKEIIKKNNIELSVSINNQNNIKINGDRNQVN